MIQPLFQLEPQATFTEAAPVLKWAGGKGQLLPQLRERYPKELEQGRLTTYIEPFFGGGAVFFDLIKTYPTLKQVHLCDVNPELIVLYSVIQKDVDALVAELRDLEASYLALGEEGRKACFYEVRDAFNLEHDTFNFEVYSAAWISRAAKTLFLNKTCFNGLFRVNSKGYFNVPHGRYKNPRVLNEVRLRAGNEALQRTEIRLGDFSQIAELVDDETFIYYDPPYRPISETSTFTSYAGEFNDDSQRRLATLYRELSGVGAKQLLSNSDPTNHVADPFFDELYWDFCIERINANRMINSKASKRGAIREILVRNYEV